MSTSNLQAELDQNLALRKAVNYRISIILRVIEMIESGNQMYEFFMTHIGPDNGQVLDLIRPNIKIMNEELIYFMKMLSSIQKNEEKIRFSQFKEWTLLEIENFHKRANRELNRVAKEMTNEPLKNYENVFNGLIAESDSILESLCRLVSREPKRENMILLYKEIAHNMSLGGERKTGKSLKTLSDVSLLRLKYADNHYRPEIRYQDYVKLIKALEDALISGVDDPLVQKVGQRIADIQILKKYENKRTKKKHYSL
jgi:hypothetical protein